MTRAFRVLFMLYLWCTAAADSGVKVLLRTDQFITSSTLHWIPGTGDITQLKDAVTAGTLTNGYGAPEAGPGDAVYVCRAQHSGTWVPGQLRPKYRNCTVSLYGTVLHLTRYEILQNLEGGARLNWVPFDKFTAEVPVGAVATEQKPYPIYVARREVDTSDKISSETPDYTHYGGRYVPEEGMGKIFVVDYKGRDLLFDNGEVLKETEPVSYELKHVNIMMSKKHASRIPRVLGHTVLINEGNTPTLVDGLINYNFRYSLSWGHGHAILTGLNTTIHMKNGTRLPNITWGTEYEEERDDFFKVEAFLEPGTAVNITLRANYTNLDVPYSAILVSHYSDDHIQNRTIHGSRVELAMTDVHAEFGQIYFTHNGSFVPTTTTTTTTTTTKTTLAAADEAPAVYENTAVVVKEDSPETGSSNGNGRKISEESAQLLDKKNDVSLAGPSVPRSSSGGSQNLSMSVVPILAAFAALAILATQKL